MKKLALITLLTFGIYASAQTPFDSFAPEVSKPILELREQVHNPDTLLCSIVADIPHQILLLVDVSTREVIATAPITDGISKWLSVDPLADNYPGISPYAYAAWNPVKFIDPDGNDIYTFDEDGSFLYKKVQEGIHYGVVLKNGEQDFRFDFADPINDPRSIDEGNVNRVLFVTDAQISQILAESGVFDSHNKRNKYTFIRNESNANNINGNGLMDYVATGLFVGANISTYNNSLFITDSNGEKMAHNTYNFGNFLWGAGAATIGVPYCAAFIGSHWNNFFNDPSSRWHFDSKDDQLSIKLGFQWQQKSK